MKRVVIYSKNTLTICDQLASDPIQSYAPIFSIKKTNEFELTLSPMATQYYKVPSEVNSVTEKAAYLINLISRAEATDMHKVLKLFITGKLTTDSMFIFEKDGSLMREPDVALQLINKI